jgi:hypothetical protein
MGFKEFIKGKKVVFVGACPNLVDRDMGKLIDSYDIVVKSGHSWAFNKDKYYKDYGRRCDVAYVNRQYYREMKPFPIKEMKIRGVKWLCLKGSSQEDLNEFNKYICARTIRDVFLKVNKALKSASMGNYIIQDILDQQPALLYMTGIDFFASKNPAFVHDNYQEYLDGYLPQKIRSQGNIINVGKKEDGHDFNGNAKFFYNLFMSHPNFKTDDFIMDLLSGIVEGRIKQGDVKWTTTNGIS